MEHWLLQQFPDLMLHKGINDELIWCGTVISAHSGLIVRGTIIRGFASAFLKVATCNFSAGYETKVRAFRNVLLF